MRKLLSIILVCSIIMSSISIVSADDDLIDIESTDEPVITSEPEATDNVDVTTEPLETDNPDVNTSTEPTSTPEPVVYDLGDVDGSSVINAADALAVLKDAAQIESLDEASTIAADVDKNGKADAKDALYILQYAAKIIVRFVFTPEENFQILKDYIKENGVVDASGVYTISRDYVAENDSNYNVEVDSFSYDAVNDLLLYKYDVDITDDSRNYVYSYIIELSESESNIRLVYDEDSTEMRISWDVSQKVYNSQLKITKFFDAGLIKEKNIALLKGFDITDADKEKFNSDNKKYINAMMHSAVLSMEDYLNSMLVMKLKDLGFTSYTYTDDQLYKVFAPLYGIDTDIQENYEIIKELIIKKGKREGDEIIINNGTIGGENEPYVDSFESETYLIYNETEDTVYFNGVVYTNPTGHAASVAIQPFVDGYSYCVVNLYEPGLENYELIYNVEFIERSSKFKYRANYDYEYIEPENGKMSDIEDAIASYCIARVLDDVWYALWSKGDTMDSNDLLSNIGFINIH